VAIGEAQKTSSHIEALVVRDMPRCPTLISAMCIVVVNAETLVRHRAAPSADDLAQEIVRALGMASGDVQSPAKIEQQIDIPTGSKDIQSHLQHAQSLFNNASSVGQSNVEKAIEKEMAMALSKQPQVGAPETPASMSVPLKCLPDLNKCPKSWSSQGSSCLPPASYTGPCTQSVVFFDLAVDEKLALARYCKASFVCQEECAQNFEAVCPSLWREIAPRVCESPENYVGDCGRRVNVGTMTESAKMKFSQDCGARWPCSAPVGRAYNQVCPRGWTLKFGKSCEAPPGYNGLCGPIVQMDGMSIAEKYAFEVRCAVAWPEEQAPCERDLAAPCPNGWQTVTRDGIVECVAPASYSQCSRVQTFQSITPHEKGLWQRKCGQQFPCLSMSKQNPSTSVNPSFLASKVFPVDAYKIRNGLHLTEAMVAPGRAVVNVIEHEHLERTSQEIKYHGMSSRISRLKLLVNQMLNAMVKA